MTAATIRIPAKSTQISEGHLGYGVDILAQVRLDTLADALNAMEHDDLDPGERPMNADQCRDALLRELLGGWTPSELVEAKISGVLELWEQLNVARACQRLQADEIATLRRERDEARAVLTDLVHAVDEADELHESGVALDWSIMVRARGVPGVITFHGDDGFTTPTPGAQA